VQQLDATFSVPSSPLSSHARERKRERERERERAREGASERGEPRRERERERETERRERELYTRTLTFQNFSQYIMELGAAQQTKNTFKMPVMEEEQPHNPPSADLTSRKNF